MLPMNDIRHFESCHAKPINLNNQSDISELYYFIYIILYILFNIYILYIVSLLNTIKEFNLDQDNQFQ